MSSKKYKSKSSIINALSLGISLGIIFWCIDAAVETFIFNHNEFVENLQSLEIGHLAMRSAVLLLMVFVTLSFRKIINKRYSIENALMESAEKYEKILEASPDGIIIHTLDYIIDANQATADMLGHELKDIIRKSFFSFLDEASQKVARTNFENDNEKTYQLTVRMKSGTPLKVKINSRKISYRGEEAHVSTITPVNAEAVGTKDKPAKDKPVEDGRYRRLLQSGNDPVFIYGLTNENSPDKFIEVNVMAGTKFGYSQEEFKNINLMDMVVPNDRDNILPIFQTLIDFKHSIFETELLSKDKNLIPVEISSHLFELDNRPVIISSLRETTERKKAERLLRDSEKQYRSLFKHAPTACMVIDKEGNIIDANDRFFKLLDYSKAEVIDAWYGDFLSRTSLDRFKAALADLIDTGKNIHTELEFAGKNDSRHKVSVRTECIKDATGGIQSIICLLNNISIQEQSLLAKSAEQNWLKNIFQLSENIIFSCNLNGRVIEANPAIEKILGFAFDPEIDLRFDSLVHADDKNFFNQSLEKCAQGERIPTIEVRLCSGPGVYLPVEIGLYQYKSDDDVIIIKGIVTGLFKPRQNQETSTKADTVSNEKNQLEVNKETSPPSDLSYQTLASNIPGLVYRILCNENNRMLFINDKLGALTGYSENELTNNSTFTIEQFILEEDRPKIVMERNRATEENTTFEIEYQFKHNSGEIKTFVDRGKPVFDSGGKLISIDGVIFDITERKQAQKTLKETEERFERLIKENTNLLKESEQRLKSAEEELENYRANMEDNFEKRTSELTKSIEPLKKEIEELKSAEAGLQKLLANNKKILETAPVIIMEVDSEQVYRWSNKAGYNFFGEDIIGKKTSDYFEGEQTTFDTIKSQTNGNNEVLYVESWHKRKDDKKRLLAWWCRQLKDADGNFSGMLLTASDITDRRTIEDEKTLSGKLESFAVFADGFAHDINNTLAAILGNITLAQMDAPTGSDLEVRLAEAEKASESVRDLTQQLYVFSQASASGKKKVSVRDILRKTVEQANAASNFAVKLNSPENLALIDANADQIDRALTNLLDYARQSTPDGGKIEVSAEDTLITDDISMPVKKGKYLKISIVREGAGISEKDLSRLFEPYYSTGKYRSGLNLATAYSIIRNHDGNIEAKSNGESGTILNIYLPVSEDQSPAGVETDNSQIENRGKILLIESDDSLGKITEAVLLKIGYLAELTDSGAGAIEKFRQALDDGHPYNLVVLNLNIAGDMNAQETFDKIKEIDLNIKAIVSDENSNNPIMANYEQFGFCGALLKPYKASTVERLVNQVLQKDAVQV